MDSSIDSISSKDSLLRNNLVKFYSNKENLNIFLPIILQQTRLSLRSLDWFVTNYCKKYNINYIHNDTNYFPYKAYKAQLKAYSKKYCDPFCRRDRVIFDYQQNQITETKPEHNEWILTTIGQLNFFKFAISDHIINYAIQNIELIENDMNKTLKTRESEKKKSTTGTEFVNIKTLKRKELSVPGNKSVHITQISAIIKFT